LRAAELILRAAELIPVLRAAELLILKNSQGDLSQKFVPESFPSEKRIEISKWKT